MSNCKSILIVGNGLDLSCRLKSTYSDFFNNKYDDKISRYFDSNVISNGPPRQMYSDDFNYSLLDFIFIATSKKSGQIVYWNDVETIIGDTLLSSPFGITKLVKEFELSIQGAQRGYIDKENTVIRSKIIEALVSKGVLPYPNAKIESISAIREILWEELFAGVKKLEKEFKEYLISEVSNSAFYKKNLEQIYIHLLGEDLSNTFVISFNYTDALTKCFYEFEHVHGSLGSGLNVVFGIDENRVNHSDMFEYQFSKTYRKIELDTLSKNEIKKMPRDIEQIIFFGHSLSVADYSYFQSIFDYYNIYDSDVDLVFYYVNYSKEAFPRCLEAITKLIKRYGETLDNKDHGKNLLHKLSLECRLKVKEIQIEYDEETNLITSIQ